MSLSSQYNDCFWNNTGLIHCRLRDDVINMTSSDARNRCGSHGIKKAQLWHINEKLYGINRFWGWLYWIRPHSPRLIVNIAECGSWSILTNLLMSCHVESTVKCVCIAVPTQEHIDNERIASAKEEAAAAINRPVDTPSSVVLDRSSSSCKLCGRGSSV